MVPKSLCRLVHNNYVYTGCKYLWHVDQIQQISDVWKPLSLIDGVYIVMVIEYRRKLHRMKEQYKIQ